MLIAPALLEGVSGDFWSYVGVAKQVQVAADAAALLTAPSGDVGDLLIAASYGSIISIWTGYSSTQSTSQGGVGMRIATNTSDDNITTGATPGQGGVTYIARFRARSDTPTFLRSGSQVVGGNAPDQIKTDAMLADAGIVDSLLFILGGFGANNKYDTATDNALLVQGDLSANWTLIDADTSWTATGTNQPYRGSGIMFQNEATAAAYSTETFTVNGGITDSSSASVAVTYRVKVV